MCHMVLARENYSCYLLKPGLPWNCWDFGGSCIYQRRKAFFWGNVPFCVLSQATDVPGNLSVAGEWSG